MTDTVEMAMPATAQIATMATIIFFILFLLPPSAVLKNTKDRAGRLCPSLFHFVIRSPGLPGFILYMAGAPAVKQTGGGKATEELMDVLPALLGGHALLTGGVQKAEEAGADEAGRLSGREAGVLGRHVPDRQLFRVFQEIFIEGRAEGPVRGLRDGFPPGPVFLKAPEEGIKIIPIRLGGVIGGIVPGLERVTGIHDLLKKIPQDLIQEGLLIGVIGIEGDTAYPGRPAEFGDSDLLVFFF